MTTKRTATISWLASPPCPPLAFAVKRTYGMLRISRQRREYESVSFLLSIVCTSSMYLQVAARTTAIGFGLSIIAHYAWPWYRYLSFPCCLDRPTNHQRRQPMSFKGFLVVTSGVFGLVFGAEHALLEYEAERRVQENAVRRQARLELTRRGIVPTETEINKWRLAKESGE